MKSNKEQFLEFIGNLGIAFFIIIILLLVGWFCYGSYYTLDNFYKFGGVLSGIFAGLAFLGVIWTLYFQHKQADLQKKHNDDQLMISNQNQKETQKNENIRRFENTFFNMMTLLQEIIDGLSVDNGNGKSNKYTGRHVFEVQYGIEPMIIFWTEENDDILNKYLIRELKIGRKGIITDEGGLRAVISNYGATCYRDIDNVKMFDHYFRIIYRMLDYLDDKKKDYLTYEERYEYAAIIRATLSPYELLWIYYNGLFGAGNPKLKRLIERYALLKNIREDLLITSREVFEYTQGKYYLNDYSYYLTNDKNDENKYYAGAFYNKKELALKGLTVME